MEARWTIARMRRMHDTWLQEAQRLVDLEEDGDNMRVRMLRDGRSLGLQAAARDLDAFIHELVAQEARHVRSTP